MYYFAGSSKRPYDQSSNAIRCLHHILWNGHQGEESLQKVPLALYHHRWSPSNQEWEVSLVNSTPPSASLSQCPLNSHQIIFSSFPASFSQCPLRPHQIILCSFCGYFTEQNLISIEDITSTQFWIRHNCKSSILLHFQIENWTAARHVRIMMTVTAVSWEGHLPTYVQCCWCNTSLFLQALLRRLGRTAVWWRMGQSMILSLLNSDYHYWSDSLLADGENVQDILQTAHHRHPASKQPSRAVGASEFPSSWGLCFSRGIWWVVFSERQRLWGRSSRAVAQGTSQCTDLILPSMAASAFLIWLTI